MKIFNLKSFIVWSFLFVFVVAGSENLFASSNEADLETEFLGRQRPFVYNPYRYRVRVTNNGTVRADDVTISIDMPITDTSPNQFIMGTVTDLDSRCQIISNKIECNIGRIKPGKRKAIRFNFEFPVSSKSLAMTATATTSTNESNLTDNSATKSPQFKYVQNVVSGGNYLISFCGGTNLTAFFECTLFPSSIQSLAATLNSNGTVSYTNYPNLTGSWYQPSSKKLVFDTYDGSNQLNVFEGYAVNANCFEGITTYPNSTNGFVAPTRICIQ